MPRRTRNTRGGKDGQQKFRWPLQTEFHRHVAILKPGTEVPLGLEGRNGKPMWKGWDSRRDPLKDLHRDDARGRKTHPLILLKIHRGKVLTRGNNLPALLTWQLYQRIRR
jgi:hypothetical protein